MGNKNSGRRSYRSEVDAGNFGDKMLKWILDNWDTLPKKDQIKVAMAFGLKVLPDKVESKSEVELTEVKQESLVTALRHASKNRVHELVEN